MCRCKRQRMFRRKTERHPECLSELHSKSHIYVGLVTAYIHMHADLKMTQGGVTTNVVLRLIHARHGINLRWLNNNSVLLLTVVFTLSVHRGHYIEVIIRCTWNWAYFKHDKVWDLLRELIPKGFLSRSPQRKCRNVCKHDCLTVKNECFSNYFSLIMSVWISDADS